MTLELMDDATKKKMRVVPADPLDYTMLVTEPEWGKEGIGAELKEKLSTRKAVFKDAKGNMYVDKQSLWSLLGFYTRDMRLANLDKQEGLYCRHYIDLANDLLNVDMLEPFLISLSRAATVLELSQSKRGFLRQQNNTLRTESIQQSLEPPKKSILQQKRKD